MYFQRFYKTILITSTLALTPALWAPAFAYSPQEKIVENWVSSANDAAFLTVSLGDIAHNAASNITTVKNLSIQFKFSGVKSSVTVGTVTAKAEGKLDYIITFPSIEFASLTLENGYYSAKSITAEIANLKFTIAGDQASSSSATGTYDNFRVDNIKWASVPEIVEAPNKPFSKYYPLIEALVDISFDSASLGGMTLNQTTGNLMSGDQTAEQTGINMRMTYGATSIGKTIRGNFTSMLVAGMKMNMSAADGVSPEAAKAMKSEFSIGEMSVSNYDYGTLVRNFEPGLISNGDAPYNMVLGDMSLRDFKVKFATGEFSMANWSMRDLGVRPPRVSVLEEADRLFVEQMATGAKPDPKTLVELFAGVYGAFRIGNAEFSGLNVDVPGVAKGKVDLYRIHDLSANGLGEFLLKGINFTGAGNYFNLDLFSIADVKFPALQALMDLGDEKNQNDVTAIMKAIPTVGRYQTKGLEVRVAGKGDVFLNNSKLEMADFIGPIPTKVDLTVVGLKLPVSLLEGKAKQVFSAMGFKDILVSYGLKAAWEEPTKVLSMNTSANLKDGGNLDVDISIGGIPRSMFENPTTAQQVVALLTINSANIAFDDQSIVEKGMSIVAAKQGVDVVTLKAQAVGMLPFVLQMLNNPQFVGELSEAVKKFLDTGGTIVASAAPSAPISIIQLMGVGASAPGAIIDLLNIKVKAE